LKSFNIQVSICPENLAANSRQRINSRQRSNIEIQPSQATIYGKQGARLGDRFEPRGCWPALPETLTMQNRLLPPVPVSANGTVCKGAAIGISAERGKAELLTFLMLPTMQLFPLQGEHSQSG